MNYEINLTPEAKNDLIDIFKYIAFDLQSAQNAASQLERIEKGIKSLSQMPERFRVYETEPWQSRNLRIMPIDSYLIFYIPIHGKSTVTIIRILYHRQNIDLHLMNL